MLVTTYIHTCTLQVAQKSLAYIPNARRTNNRFVIWVLNKGGPKPAIIITSSFLLVGNWLRYAGTKANGGIFGLVMFGQILIGLAQPFCLCAPTRYSDLWFSDKGRTSATAVASLANPLGAAIGQLVDSEWATKPSDIPNMVLYISIIVSSIIIAYEQRCFE